MSSVFIISAPSGSGKSTLVNRLMESDKNLIFSVSYTTRERRAASRSTGSSTTSSAGRNFEARIAE